MAAATKPPIVDDEIDPLHPQFQAGMQAGVTAAGAFANLPRMPNPSATTGVTAPEPPVTTAPSPPALGGAINGLPRTVGAGPAVGGTQAVLPPPINLPRKRNQSAVLQPNPADFFKRK